MGPVLGIKRTSDLVKLLGSLVTTKEAEIEQIRAEADPVRAEAQQARAALLR